MRTYIFLIITSLIWACQSSQEEVCHINAGVNPNGESEMALFMRRIASECDLVKAQILKKEKAQFNFEPTQILKATMTKGHSMDGAYIAYAKTFINQVEQFNEDANKNNYNAIILNCINCHKTRCPGPIDRIKKLKLP